MPLHRWDKRQQLRTSTTLPASGLYKGQLLQLHQHFISFALALPLHSSIHNSIALFHIAKVTHVVHNLWTCIWWPTWTVVFALMYAVYPTWGPMNKPWTGNPVFKLFLYWKSWLCDCTGYCSYRSYEAFIDTGWGRECKSIRVQWKWSANRVEVVDPCGKSFVGLGKARKGKPRTEFYSWFFPSGVYLR